MTPDELNNQKSVAVGFRDECYNYACIFNEEYRAFAVKLAQEQGLEYEVAAAMAGMVLIRMGGEIMAAAVGLERDSLPEFLRDFVATSTDKIMDESARQEKARKTGSQADE